MRSCGSASGLRLATQTPLTFLHHDVRIRRSASPVAANAAPGRGLRLWIELLRLAQLVVPALQRLLQPARSRARRAARGASARARARRSRGWASTPACASSCSSRHSAQLRAPTPVGSRFCRCLQRDRQLLGLDLQLLGHDLRELFQRLREIAVLVERLDQKRHQVAVARFQLGEGELAGANARGGWETRPRPAANSRSRRHRRAHPRSSRSAPTQSSSAE